MNWIKGVDESWDHEYYCGPAKDTRGRTGKGTVGTRVMEKGVDSILLDCEGHL